jgi:signal transduction histidine kinase
LSRVTTTIEGIAYGEQPASLPEHDLSEIDALYQSVNELAGRLRTLEDARKRLLANLVHELGRPLGSIRAAVHALRNGADDDPALRLELLGGINSQIEHMQPLLDNLTSLHGQVLGTLELSRKPTPLAPWLQQAITLWRAAALEKGVTWKVDVPLNLPTVALDGDQMGRAVGNLLSNAVKFTPAGGAITVAAAVKSPQQVAISVADTGPGIAPVDQQRIFEPFQRGQSGRRFPQGVGLGLSIARDVVQAHGGSITLDSAPGQGSRFTILLPLEQ